MIRNWPSAIRPREKLINEGAQSLSDAELIAIILRTGARGKSVVELAQELLNTFGDIRGLLACELAELQKFKGLGPVKYTQIAAIKAIAHRNLKSELKSQPSLDNPRSAADFLLTTMRDYKHEVFACLLVNNRNQLIRYVELFSGSINGASIYPREVLKLVLRLNAAAIIFAHNHPSGTCYPSVADKDITQRLKEALDLVDVRVLDHIIVGETTFSMAEHGML